MRKRLIGRPSPATVIASVALFVSLGGVGYAAATGSIDSREIKNNDVRTKDLKNNDVRGKDIRTGTVTGSDVANNSLTGADILESSLGTVPSAANAGSANTAGFANSAGSANTANSASTAGSVGGISFRGFRYRVPGAAPATQVLSFGGLVLTASCSGATLSFSATTTVADAQLDSYSVDPQAGTPLLENGAEDTDFDPADPAVNLVPNDEDDEVGSLRYSKPDGSGVSVEWHAHTAGAAGCGVSGVASAY